MTRKKKLTLLAIIVLVLLFIIWWLLSLRKETPTGALSPSVPQIIAPAPPLPELQLPTKIEPPPPGPQEQKPEVIASLFTERYGSYSNQSNYENLRDLFSQMTSAMQSRTEEFINKNPLRDGDYSGTTVKTVRTEVKEKTATRAQISVYTQRIEATAQSPRARTSYPTAELVLTKSGLLWLVDSFTWK